MLVALAQKNIKLEEEVTEKEDTLADYIQKGFPL
jgi:hypothetical protein